jgi:hypothetical protein
MISATLSYFGMALSWLCLIVLARSAVQFHKTRKLKDIGVAGVLPFLNRVNIKGIKHLIDPMEEAFLRQAHSRKQFCDMQRDRILSASEYFRKMGNNAAVLQKIGYRTLGSRDDQQRAIARELIDAGVPVRIYAVTAVLVLRFWQTFRIHRLMLSAPSLADLKDLVAELLCSYDHLKEVASAMTMLKEPNAHDELLSNL